MIWKKADSKMPTFLKVLKRNENAGVEELGPNGPWLIERIAGMREFPNDMDVDAKVSMLEEAIRRLCTGSNEEVDNNLFQHVKEQTRVWTSDGADMKVPNVAKREFPRLEFHAWDESHSAQRLGANAMKDFDEITITDKLLVTGKKPPSLAKFITTSSVVRQKLHDASQRDEAVAFVSNFGWAPQRFNSRARPYARAARRWESIFKALESEANGRDEGRAKLAKMFFMELGSANSWRLLLGGLMADLSAEHYTWVASADSAFPDSTTACSRADDFLNRIHELFTKGGILAVPESFTGVTLEFLRQQHIYNVGKTTVSIGIERHPNADMMIQEALHRVKRIVANIVEYMKLYRSDDSWYRDFAAFRLPSPLSASDRASPAFRKARRSLVKIGHAAGLRSRQDLEEMIEEMIWLVPYATKFHDEGLNPRAAWGRASALWPEKKKARRLVQIFLIWKTSTGNLERRFGRFRDLRCPERARFLDVSVEDCMIVEQAPPSQMLRRPDGDYYLDDVLKLHAKLHCNVKPRIRQAQRRDAGVPRRRSSAGVGPDTEVAFGRKREAGVAAITTASESKRAAIIARAPYGLDKVVGKVRLQPAVEPVSGVRETVAKRIAAAKDSPPP